ncbi:TlpA disulfide reductase family protein [Mariniflexile litorale]|uniref:TlpA disulfide reductase family protein n=1 Tax=Mariniflexile litorale TaxID=3045158 RepID=A0AAU7EC34_9FLAO|nr:TlpA disulfide reductase family protein [Mariniflexile sp. KMM 9835]MDQ8212977.1 TlpA disulfide reductase family protein [Mariniflexile sp. KMM 9835]
MPLDATISNGNMGVRVHFIYHPGDSIHLEFEAQEKQLSFLKAVKFSGDGAKTNNQIVEFQILREENNLGYEAINESESIKKRLEDFLVEISLLKERQLNTYKTFVEKQHPTNEAKNWTALFALETYYYFLDKYSWNNENLPNDYFDYTKEILPLTLNKLICWKVMENRIMQYNKSILFPKFREQYPEIDLISSITDKIATTDALFIKLVSNHSSNNLLNQLVYSGLYKELISNNMLDSYQRNKVVLETKISEPFIKKSLQETFEKATNNLKSPKEKTTALLQKMKGSPIEETFSKILEDNKGKVIYLDIWGTTCPPCIKEMPASKLLISKFKQQDIAFVYMCIYGNENRWKELLSEFKLDGGQQYRVDDMQRQSLQDLMEFNAIPYYILIDKNGHIVDRGLHLSPSMKYTEDKINELTNE